MILLFAILFNSLEAVYEGLYDKGIKLWSGIVEFVLKAIIIFVCLNWFAGIHPMIHYEPLWKTILGFVFIRFLIFDIIYNLTRGLQWNYIGNTKIYDKLISKLGGFGWFVRLILGIIGIVFLLQAPHLY